MTSNTINIAFANINGFGNKVDQIRDYMMKEKIDIICLVETWLQYKDNVALRPVVLDVRRIAEQHQGSCRGTEGILIITVPELRNKIKIKKVDVNKRWVELQINDIVIICAYHPPSMDMNDVKMFWKEMNKKARDIVTINNNNNNNLSLIHI